MDHPSIRTGDLEISQDLGAQHTTWVLQRIGWVGMALLILTALAGGFGDGPLVHRMVSDDHHLFSLEYDRVCRYESEQLLRLTLAPETTKTPHVDVWISRSYWSSHAIEQITPEPRTSSTSSDGFVYTFDVDARNEPAMIVMRLRPEYVGSMEGHIRVNDQGSVTIHQLTFP
jgi:hypothetical protein